MIMTAWPAGPGEKLNVEGFKRGRGSHAMPRARKKQGSTHLAGSLIDHCFDGEESPNPDHQQRKTYHPTPHPAVECQAVHSTTQLECRRYKTPTADLMYDRRQRAKHNRLGEKAGGQ